ncbi:MAG: metallophosphoesterase [Eubacteriales bacterium]|nr:metallophosphoesterase [Eubacteriales bacterium]
MKVLVIPDIHLKPWMFYQAMDLMEKGIAEQAVCLMDIPDDWNQEFNLELYQQTYDAAIEFARKYPHSRWCYGNHDLSYQWQYLESGYSSMAAFLVRKNMTKLEETLDEDNPIQYVHRIDNVLFSHGGVSDYFVRLRLTTAACRNEEKALKEINALADSEMWKDESPIWLRPQHGKVKMYRPRKFLQVVGHTPVHEITRQGNILSTDVFSTYRDGSPIGTQQFLLLDTVTWQWEPVNI